MGPSKTRSNLAVALVVALLCAMLIGLGLLMGTSSVFGIDARCFYAGAHCRARAGR